MLAQGPDSQFDVPLGRDAFAGPSGGGFSGRDQRGLGELGLQLGHGRLVLEPLPLPLVLDLLELAAELVPLLQRLGQLSSKVSAGSVASLVRQLLPGGAEPKILGLKGLDHCGVGAGACGGSPVIACVPPGAGAWAWATSAWSRAISP